LWRRLGPVPCPEAGPDPPPRGRRGTDGDATSRGEGAAWRSGGFRGWKGRGPSAVDSTLPGASPKYPELGQQGSDLSESQGDRISSGAGVFPCGFPNPRYYLFELLAVEGFICLAHLGWPLWPLALEFGKDLLAVARPSPSPFDKTN